MKFVNLQRQDQQQQDLYKPEVTQNPPWKVVAAVKQEVVCTTIEPQNVELTPRNLREFHDRSFSFDISLYEKKGLNSYTGQSSQFPVSKHTELSLKYPDSPEGTTKLAMQGAYSRFFSLKNLVSSMISFGLDTSGKLQEILSQSENLPLEGPRGISERQSIMEVALSNDIGRVVDKSSYGGIIGTFAGMPIASLAGGPHQLGVLAATTVAGSMVGFVLSRGLTLPQRMRQKYAEYQARSEVISNLRSTLTTVFEEYPEIKDIVHSRLIDVAKRKIHDPTSSKATLLRASTAPDDGVTTLLRPASGSSTQPHELLRASEK